MLDPHSLVLYRYCIWIIHRNVDLKCFFFNFIKMFVIIVIQSYFIYISQGKCKDAFTVWWNIQGGPKKLHKVHGTIILQRYVIESCGFQQNVPKEILYTTKVSI